MKPLLSLFTKGFGVLQFIGVISFCFVHTVFAIVGSAFRISITFRKMDESKRPVGFTPEPDLEEIKPLPYEHTTPSTPADAVISSSRSSIDQNGSNHNNRTAHGGGSKYRRSRDYHSESRERSSSGQRRETSRHTPNRSYRPKVTSSDNV